MNASEGPAAGSWLIPVLVALIGVFISVLSSSIINVANASIMAVFNTDTAGVQWVSTAYTLAMAMIIPMSGWLGDKFGLKRLYVLSLAVFVAGSVLCAVAWSLESLIVARIIQAVGGGILSPVVTAMVYRLVPRKEIGGAMGILGMAILVAPAVGPTLGGWLVQYVSWRWIFVLNLPIGILGLLLAVLLLPEFRRDPAGKFDLPGAVTAALGFAGLLYVLSKGSSWGWTSEATVLLFVASVGLLVLFVLIELFSPSPLLDMKVFAVPSFTLANLIFALINIAMFAGLFYVPLFLQAIMGLGPLQVGMVMLPGALVSAVMMPIAGKLFDRFGPLFSVVGGLLFLAYCTWLFTGLAVETSQTTVMLWLVLRSVALGLCSMPAQTAAMGDIPTPLISRASAVVNLVRNVASSFGVAGMTVLMTQRSVFHQARIRESLTTDNRALTDWLTSNPAGQSVLSIHLGQVVYVAAIRDVFLVTAFLTLAAVVPALFLKKPQPAAPTASAKTV